MTISPALTLCQQMAANLATTMDCFLAVPPVGVVERRQQASLFAAGRDRSAFNAAVLGGPVADMGEFEQSVRDAAAFFTPRSLSWCLWFCDQLMPPYTKPRSAAFLRRRGLSLASEAPALTAAELLPPFRNLPDLEVQRVRTGADARAFSHVLNAAFSGPAQQVGAVYGSEHLWSTPFRGYLARYQGFDVSIAATLAAAGLITVYTVGTLPAYTRRGFAERLIRHAIADTVAEVGPLPLAVQATGDSLRLYRRMGFRKIGDFSLYVRS